MPQISHFFGISIYVQFDDHNPPHIHAPYASYKASYDIRKVEILAGKMPGGVKIFLSDPKRPVIGLEMDSRHEDKFEHSSIRV